MNISRLLVLTTPLIGMVLGGAAVKPEPGVHSAVAAPARRPPNIIVILADDLGYADISAYRVGRFATPNIDRIGMQGVRFTDGYASAPVCGPSRAGLPHDMLIWRRRPLVSIRKGDWKLWESVNDTTGQYGEYTLLFNLRTDLNETTNLASRYPQKVKELEALIRQWAKDMTDPQWPTRPPVEYQVCGTPFRLPI